VNYWEKGEIMITPYLHFNGTCEEAFLFYADVFGGQIQSLSRFNNDSGNKVMHAAVKLTDTGGVSGSDQEGPVSVKGMEILVILPSRERVEEILPRLSEGGEVISAFQPHPPPDDAGGGAAVRDKYGYTWFLCV
jgi:PhnB protein